jgi:hypothetical protein
MKPKVLLILIILFGAITFPAHAQSITLRLPDTTVVAGDLLDLPVYADQDLSGHSVLSYQLEIGFNSTCLEPLGIIKDGTLSSTWSSVEYKNWVPGQVSVAAAGGTPLSGAGKLIIIRFRCLQAGYSSMTFTDPLKNLLNEGDPPVTLDNGYVSIQARPVITVRPETGLLTTGDELQYSVLGGTTPFTWSVTVDSVATINSDGLLTAEKRGFTQVIAEDSEGIIDTSGLLEVRGLKLSIPDTTGWQANEITIPVYSTDVSALGITSGLITLSYPVHVMDEVVEVETTGGILESVGDIQVNTGIPGKVSISFAGAATLSGSGPMFFVTFMVSRNTGGGYLEIEEAIFNQDILATHQNGYYTIKPLPDLDITPETASLLSGESQAFSASGGFTPYIWSVSNPTLASIDASGSLTALKGGILFVSVVDDIGAVGQTDTIFIYDTRVTIPDTSVELRSTFDMPVRIGELPAGVLDVSSIEAMFTFRYPELEFLGIEKGGCLTEDWYEAVKLDNDSILKVALAGSGSFNSAGTLFHLRFRLTEEFTVMENAGIWIDHFLLNEGSPAALEAGGSIYGIVLGEDLSLSSSSNLSDACELPMPIQFNLTITNNGGVTYDAGDTIHAGLILPGEGPVSFMGILDAGLPPAGSADLVLLDTVDQSFTGTFEYILYADMDEDINRNNDTIQESFTIFGYPEVDLGESTIEVSSFPYLLDAGTGYDSLVWQDGSTEQTFSAPDAGLYWVEVMRNGCPGTDTVNLILVGVELTPADEALIIFPNPSKGDFMIRDESQNGWIEIGVYNVLGSCIHHEKIHVSGGLKHRIRLEHPDRGLYLLKAGDRMKKFIIDGP